MTAFMIAVHAVANMLVHSGLRVKRRLKSRQLRAGADQHLLDGMVRQNPDCSGPDLGRHMPVAEMPGKPHELTRVAMMRFYDGFWSGPDNDPAPIPEPQPVAIGHYRRMRQIEKHRLAMIGCQRHTAAVARLEIERDAAFGL
ncbi:MAG: hypothetical protein WA384_20365 [Rhodomicrobium sp.]